MSPLEVVEQIYEAFTRSDLEVLLDAVAPDVVIVQDDTLPWGGRYVGVDGTIDFFVRLVGSVNSTLTHEALFQAGDQVVQYGRSRGVTTDGGTAFDVPECHVWTVVDGRVREARFYVDSGAMLAALGT